MYVCNMRVSRDAAHISELYAAKVALTYAKGIVSDDILRTKIARRNDESPPKPRVLQRRINRLRLNLAKQNASGCGC